MGPLRLKLITFGMFAIVLRNLRVALIYSKNQAATMTGGCSEPALNDAIKLLAGSEESVLKYGNVISSAELVLIFFLASFYLGLNHLCVTFHTLLYNCYGALYCIFNVVRICFNLNSFFHLVLHLLGLKSLLCAELPDGIVILVLRLTVFIVLSLLEIIIHRHCGAAAIALTRCYFREDHWNF